jgi:excisionase family DNA binding protein/PAS domain S-box-containing protein
MEKTLFSTPELAEWLGVFHTTVRRWIERGTIRGIRVGRNYKIPADEVIRILDGHGIPLPDVVKKYSQKKQTKDGRSVTPQGAYEGSILQKLLIVEDIKDPAFVCRKAFILGANQAFADLVGCSQADLIGLNLAEVVDESSREGLIDFAQRRIAEPEKGPSAYVARLKTGKRRKKMRITAGSLDHMKDVFLVVVTGV